jgi:excisionase family DNA binding protein
MRDTRISQSTTPASPSAQFLTPKDAAALLSVPASTAVLWCRTGRLPAVRIGKHWLIPATALEGLGVQAVSNARERREGGHA